MSNGRLKLGTDVVLVENGQYLAPLAARYWRLMKAAALRDGVSLSINEGYRSFARQVYYRTGWLARLPGFNPAGIPGTSKHGDGLAVDVFLHAGVFEWLIANGPRFGFTWAQGRQDDEKWHWVFEGVTRPASVPTTTKRKRVTMLPILIVDAKNKLGGGTRTYTFAPGLFIETTGQQSANSIAAILLQGSKTPNLTYAELADYARASNACDPDLLARIEAAAA